MSLWSRDLCKVMSTLRAAILVMSQENFKIFHYFYFDVFENFLIAHIFNIICHAQKDWAVLLVSWCILYNKLVIST